MLPTRSDDDHLFTYDTFTYYSILTLSLQVQEHSLRRFDVGSNLDLSGFGAHMPKVS